MIPEEHRHDAIYFTDGPPHPRRWVTLSLCAGLLLAGSGLVLFLVLVVAPSAGAAGGCGGG